MFLGDMRLNARMTAWQDLRNGTRTASRLGRGSSLKVHVAPSPSRAQPQAWPSKDGRWLLVGAEALEAGQATSLWHIDTSLNARRLACTEGSGFKILRLQHEEPAGPRVCGRVRLWCLLRRLLIDTKSWVLTLCQIKPPGLMDERKFAEAQAAMA